MQKTKDNIAKQWESKLSNEKLVYIAGKYYEKSIGARLFNTHKMIDAGIELYIKSNKKLVPYIPTWTHWMEERMDYLKYPERPNEFWYAFDDVFLPKCDALVKICDLGISKGADLEEKLAKKLNIPVYYSIKEILEKELEQ